MKTWKTNALAALCAVALGGLTGCEAPGDLGRDDDLQEYPEKPEPGPLTGDEATGAGDVYDQPSGVPGQAPIQQPLDQPEGIEQQGIEQQQQLEQEQQLEQQQLEQQQGIEQEGMLPDEPNLGAGTSGTVEGTEGSTEIEDDTSGVSGSGAFDEEEGDVMGPGSTGGTGGTGGTGF